MFRLTVYAHFLKSILDQIALTCGDFIVLELNSGSLTVKGNNGNQQLIVNHRLPEEAVSTTGALALPSRKLMDIIGSFFPDAKVTIEEVPDKTIVKSGRSRFRVATRSVEKIPLKTHIVQSTFQFKCKGHALQESLAAVQFCAALDDVRTYLCGVNLSLDDGVIKLVASNGHILGYVDFMATESHKSGACIIPRKSVENIRRLTNTASSIYLVANESALVVRGEGFEYTTNLIDGSFPDTDALIPDFDTNVMLPTKMFTEAVKRVGILADEKLPSVGLCFEENSLKIQSGSVAEESQEHLDIGNSEFSGDVRLSLNYVGSIFGSIKSNTVSCSFAGDLAPVVVHGTVGNTNKYILTPMRA